MYVSVSSKRTKKWKQRHLLDHLGDHKGTLLIKDFGQDLQT